ncbi:phage shock protein C (PspC) family protein [Microbacterium sp. AG790]|uniref:PspC domain-containing protein n=1 Tax=Microbacterium sp. AG790 TaxID=2183995 RepID=UPI000EB0F983|nr:PspC domain-containing protein [Microbacterium sp. AG790]RKS94366.1 phage shock protein C (PspC) family protein [Microbacterium sp. AG790]
MTTPPVEPPQTTTTTPPPPAGSHAAADSRTAGDRFFSWTAGLGLARSDGWIGGVAAGIAARLRIDPLIVRGILVVVALFGFPVIFLYALAWALLPDLDGRILLRDALRRRFEPAQVGILGLLILGLIPLGPGVVFVGGIPRWMLSPGLGGWSALSALLVTVGLVITGALLFIIVRAARHSARSASPAPPQQRASAADASPDASAAATGSGPVAPADPQGTDAAGFAASAPALSSDEDAYAAWREQHAAWKVQDDAWRRQQQDADRAVREQARRERQERATAFAAEAAERRRLRRLSSPRTPLAFVGVAVGVAVIAGTATAIAQRDALGAARGLFVAAVALGLSMVVAGVLRRRSGFLAFVTVVTLLGAGAATAIPIAQTLHIGSYWIAVGDASQPDTSASDPFVQTWGDLVIVAPDNGVDGSVYVEKTSGNTQIMAEPLDGSVRMDIEITTRDAAVDRVRLTDADGTSYARLSDDPDVTSTRLADGRIRLTTTVGGANARTHHRIVIEQDSGFISVMQSSPATTTGGSR